MRNLLPCVCTNQVRTTKKTSTNGISKTKTHLRKASSTSADEALGDPKPSKTKSARVKSTTNDSTKTRPRASKKQDNGEMSRKRKKGLKEWEDDTEDEEEDFEDVDDDDDDSGSEVGEENVKDKQDNCLPSEKEGKFRPMNLRQRPAMTSLANISTASTSQKPHSSGEGKAKFQKEDFESSADEGDGTVAASTTMEVDDEQAKEAVPSTSIAADTSKENANGKRQTPKSAIDGQVASGNETPAASPRSKRRRSRKSTSGPAKGDIFAESIVTEMDQVRKEKVKDQLEKANSPSPGKRRSRRARAAAD